MPEGISEGIHATTTEYRDLVRIDLGDYLASGGSSLGTLPEQIRTACENVGFFFVINHGISEDLIGRIFAESKRFHDLPFEDKTSLQLTKTSEAILFQVPPKLSIQPITKTPNSIQMRQWFLLQNMVKIIRTGELEKGSIARTNGQTTFQDSKKLSLNI